MTTNVDVLFRYERPVSEAEMLALGKVREVYGVRRVHVNPEEMSVRVEFDATRLSREGVARLLLGAGFPILEEISLLPPQDAPALAK